MKETEDISLLIVNHNCVETEHLTDALIEAGYQAYTVNHDHNVFNLLKKRDFDLILYGVGDQRSTELDFVKRLRDSEWVRPLIMVASNSVELNLSEAYDLGVEGVFRGEVEISKFEAVMERCLAPLEEKWRRRNERFDVSLSLRLKVGGEGNQIDTKVVNIARGGMFVALKEGHPEIGDIVEFCLTFENLPFGDIEGHGKTRWVRSVDQDEENLAGVGLEFMDLSWQSVTNLMEILNAIKTKAYIPSR